MRWLYIPLLIIILITVIWLFPPASLLVPDCRLDGNFDDWKGRAFIRDFEGDGRVQHDFKSLSWATNKNDPQLYFMIERNIDFTKATEMVCRLFFDINNNGRYQDPVDKYAELLYKPGVQEAGEVTVRLYSIDGELREIYSGRWGEKIDEGASRFEFAIPMEDLRVFPAQPIRFYLSDVTGNFDRLPDYGDNQWAPFPIVIHSRVSIILVCLIWLAVTIFFYQYRIWVFYYIWGSVGLCCVLILIFHGSAIEHRLEYYTGLLLHNLLGYLGVVTYIFDRAPGTLLIFLRVDNSWTTIALDIENSGFLEMCIIFGLTMLYPVYKIFKRTALVFIGVLCVYTANLLRLIIVILTISRFGREMSFIAHTLLGRLIFFLLAVAVYWWLLTKPSLRKIGENVQNG